MQAKETWHYYLGGWLLLLIRQLMKFIRAMIVFPILKVGRMPKHIAFIMDGNRRYATLYNLPSKIVGHMHGFSKLEQILQWSLELGVEVITVYAFSIENFKRSPDEVSALMSLAIEKFKEFGQSHDFIEKHQVRVNVIGEIELLPPLVLEAARQAMSRTSKYSKHQLNICLPYTASAEILSAVKKAWAESSSSSSPNITAESIDKHMYTADCPPVDLLIRTSGEHRLSEFLTWQVTASNNNNGKATFLPFIEFVDRLWPEFHLFDYFQILLKFQLQGINQKSDPLFMHRH